MPQFTNKTASAAHQSLPNSPPEPLFCRPWDLHSSGPHSSAPPGLCSTGPHDLHSSLPLKPARPVTHRPTHLRPARLCTISAGPMLLRPTRPMLYRPARSPPGLHSSAPQGPCSTGPPDLCQAPAPQPCQACNPQAHQISAPPSTAPHAHQAHENRLLPEDLWGHAHLSPARGGL
jgi:hypothetical protein